MYWVVDWIQQKAHAQDIYHKWNILKGLKLYDPTCYTCVIYLCYIRVGIVLCSDDSQYFIDMQHNEPCDKKLYTVQKKWIFAKCFG